MAPSFLSTSRTNLPATSVPPPRPTRRQIRRRSTPRHSLLQPLESRLLLSVAVGGGWTNAGLTGTYYNNTTLTAPVTFTRKDVRIDFDWGSTLKPGGSVSAGFKDIGADNYSILWTGQLLARFSETYTFKAFADESFKLEIKKSSDAAYSTLINQTAYTGADAAGALALVAGTPYDVRITYKELTGTASVRLRWSSISTPEEVIDPVTQSGINNPDWSSAFTDIVKGARATWEGNDGGPAPALDANGWPLGNGAYIFQESLNQGTDLDPLMRGKISYSFTGKAHVSVVGNFQDNSLTYAYNAATNTSSGTFSSASAADNATVFIIRNSTRTGLVGGPAGITNLRLMRPTSPDAATTYPTNATTLFTPQIKDAMSHFTVLRHQYVANQQMNWADRTPADYANQSEGTSTNPYYFGEPSENSASWETKIMLANETGRDIMISIPTLASDAYVLNLANLFKFGSDAAGNPYTAATANPVHPPLNSNLRLYFEIENEMWNWFGVFNTDYVNLDRLTAADVDARNGLYNIFNSDNLPTTKNGAGEYTSLETWRYRKLILRTFQFSDTFRSVFGHAALPGTSTNPRVRPLYEWQYANENDTARIALTWAEKYFNNADGLNHVAVPRAVNYWLWGGGGASYYGAVNDSGLTNFPVNNSFDATTVTAGFNRNPAGTGFVYSGNAGIARDYSSTDSIPTPKTGTQVGYIEDQGSISFHFTTPTATISNIYGFSFKAVNRVKNGASSPDLQTIRIFLDDTIDITAKTFSQENGYTPPKLQTGEDAWQAHNVYWVWSNYYNTKSFYLAPGSNHKITIQGMGDLSGHNYTQQMTFFDDIRVTSVDRFFADGLPGGGEAVGQPAGQNIQDTMNNEAAWAKAYGLEQLSYESGWSLGGDDGGSWLQLAAKYGDPRTAEAQKIFMQYFYQSGSAINVFGTYPQWPSWSDYYARQGLLDVGQFPIIQGIDAFANSLPPEATNGLFGPVVLRPGTADISDDADTVTGHFSTAGGWLNWTVTVPETKTYTLSATTTGAGGSLVILADNTPFVSGTTGTSAITGNVFLTKGVHSLRVRAASSVAFTLKTLALAGLGAPASPTLTSAVDGDQSALLAWTAVAGATGYKVRYGASSGVYSHSRNVGHVTSFTLPGLTQSQQYFIVVDAYNASGESLPSNERSVIILPEAQNGTLALFEFNGKTGSEISATGFATSRVTLSTLTRGPGLTASTSDWAVDLRPNRFASETPANNTSLANALANNQYYTFAVTPTAGKKISLASLSLRSYFQDDAPPSALAITYSVNAAPFSAALTTPGDPGVPSSPWTFNLAALAALQNTTATITFRIYPYGMEGYSLTALGDPSGTDVLLTGSYTSISNAPPTLTTPATPPSTPLYTPSTPLSVLAFDNGGQGNLTYTWASVGTPPAPVKFRVNGTSAASNTVATFSKTGTYNFIVTIKDSGNLSLTSPTSVVVYPGLTTLAIIPPSPLNISTSKQLSTVTLDQFATFMPLQPPLTWSLSGPGTLSPTGLYTAPASPGTATITVTSGLKSASTTIQTTAPAPLAATSTPSGIFGSTNGLTYNLSYLGTPPGTPATLKYSWYLLSKPTGAATPTFSLNGSNAAQNTVATFNQVGTYRFYVTVYSPTAISATQIITINVLPKLSAIALSPTSATLAKSTSRQFLATAYDQFGKILTAQPTFTWKLLAGAGTLSHTGLFTAPANRGNAVIIASANSYTASARLTIT